MKILTPFVLAITIFTSSCSTYLSNETRSIASNPEFPMSLGELFTIKSTTNTQPGLDYVKYNQFRTLGDDIILEYIEDPKLDSSIAYKILPVVENQNYSVKIFYSAHAKIDMDAMIEMQTFLRNMAFTKYLDDHSLFELYYNAKANDFNSLQILAKLRASSFEAPVDKTSLVYKHFKQSPEYYQGHKENLNYWKGVVENFNSQKIYYQKDIKAQEKVRRNAMSLLDKASEDKQFRSLVAKNDRKGVADLLRQYLPWEEMAPFEKHFWETHLKIMVDPLPLEERVLIYRGIDDDIIQVANEAGKKLSKEEAIKEQKIFLMSTILTKNQGTWNRRLRSLTTMYDKFIASAGIIRMNGDELTYSYTNEFTKAARITTMFRRHAENPSGSPFLSYTPSLKIANVFGSKRNSAYFIDPRMLYLNYASPLKREAEYFLPLVSFPEDLAAVYDSTIHKDETNISQFFDRLATAKLEKELGQGKGAITLEKIKIKSQAFFDPAIKKAASESSAMNIEQKSMDLLKVLHKMPSKDAALAIHNNGGVTCSDLIKIFWK